LKRSAGADTRHVLTPRVWHRRKDTGQRRSRGLNAHILQRKRERESERERERGPELTGNRLAANQIVQCVCVCVKERERERETNWHSYHVGKSVVLPRVCVCVGLSVKQWQDEHTQR